jgi:hypothetical protein
MKSLFLIQDQDEGSSHPRTPPVHRKKAPPPPPRPPAKMGPSRHPTPTVTPFPTTAQAPGYRRRQLRRQRPPNRPLRRRFRCRHGDPRRGARPRWGRSPPALAWQGISGCMSLNITEPHPKDYCFRRNCSERRSRLSLLVSAWSPPSFPPLPFPLFPSPSPPPCTTRPPTRTSPPKQAPAPVISLDLGTQHRWYELAGPRTCARRRSCRGALVPCAPVKEQVWGLVGGRRGNGPLVRGKIRRLRASASATQRACSQPCRVQCGWGAQDRRDLDL